jgi:murein DD-endopeptidase MepM/ murein hydrolase activator NlpD
MSETSLRPRAAHRLTGNVSNNPSDARAASSNSTPASTAPTSDSVKSSEQVDASYPSSFESVFERLFARATVKFSGLAWISTSDRARSTLFRVTSHVVILAVILGAAGLAGLSQTNDAAAASDNVLASAAQLTLPEDANLIGQGGPILIDQASIAPLADPYTTIPNRPRRGIVEYTVQSGDTLFGIAALYGLKPETVLWANYDALQDNPHLLAPGLVLDIPPVDGIVYTVQAGDTVDSIAAKYNTTADAIYTAGYEWNRLKPGQPVVADTTLIIPGGSREFKAWNLTQASAAPPSASGGRTNAGLCANVTGGLVGTGSFTWPTDKHWVSGNNYTPWHQGLDLAARLGDPVYAADNGVVVYAGWNVWGYGNLVVIDHGNGWQTWYAHNSAIYVGCGQNVFQGSVIAAAGSTGHSTGPHVHFETRFEGTLPNPFNVLPPP